MMDAPVTAISTASQCFRRQTLVPLPEHPDLKADLPDGVIAILFLFLVLFLVLVLVLSYLPMQSYTVIYSYIHSYTFLCIPMHSYAFL
jgi:hypothetical protein